MAREKNKNEIKVRRPSMLFYWIAAVLFRPFVYFVWHHRAKRNGVYKLKGPMVALGNHCSTADIILSVQTLLPRRFNIITGKDLFSWPELRPFIRAFGAIPKSQCATDIASLRTMKAAVEQKRNILIYPEGKTSLDGKELHYISPSIAKFIKFLDVPVIIVKTNGGYLLKPRYFKGIRKVSRIQTETYLLLTQDEVRTLPPKEIYTRIQNALAYNDHVWQQENGVTVRHEALAKGLDYILYRCPKCQAEYEMETDGNRLICKACGNTVEYTPEGKLVPIGDSVSLDRIDLWYEFEKQAALSELCEDGFYMGKKVTMQIEDFSSGVYEERGEGEFYMNKERIGYNGTKDGEPFEISQELKTLSTIITKNKEGVDFVFGDEIYRFLFTEKKWSSKFGILVEQNYARENRLLP